CLLPASRAARRGVGARGGERDPADRAGLLPAGWRALRLRGVDRQPALPRTSDVILFLEAGYVEHGPVARLAARPLKFVIPMLGRAFATVRNGHDLRASVDGGRADRQEIHGLFAGEFRSTSTAELRGLKGFALPVFHVRTPLRIAQMTSAI